MPNTADWTVSETITPHDTDDIKGDCVGFEVITTTGDVKVRYSQTARDGTAVDDTLYVEKGDGRIFPGGIKRVFATGTTAAGIKGLYRWLDS